MSSNLKGLWLRGACLAALVAALPAMPAAGDEKVLHAFQGGNDGIGPWSALIRDKAGNLLGTTIEGGGATDCNDSIGCGTIFRVTPNGTETVVHAFAGGCDGGNPQSALVSDKSGNYFGTTEDGGICNGQGFGTVYKLDSNDVESVIYAFANGDDGEYPTGGLTIDGNGDLYGVAGGGEGTGCGGVGCGVVFELSPQGVESVLYTFQGGSDGAGPVGNLIRDAGGDLFGATLGGGGGGCSGGCGTVYKLAPDGTETILHAFQGGSDGWIPQEGIAEDGAGNLYGTTSAGGSDDEGVIFKITSAGAETVLYSFNEQAGGYDPGAGVIIDKSGNIYGTTEFGGGVSCGKSGGCGVAYMLAPDGTETVLKAFGKDRLGRQPETTLLSGRHGTFYGTTLEGGKPNYGVVFKLKNNS